MGSGFAFLHSLVCDASLSNLCSNSRERARRRSTLSSTTTPPTLVFAWAQNASLYLTLASSALLAPPHPECLNVI